MLAGAALPGFDAVGANRQILERWFPTSNSPIADIDRLCKLAGVDWGVAMQLEAAQRAMRTAHVSGAPGVLVSGVVWVDAGVIWARADVAQAFVMLFFGGMAIVPGGLFIARVILRAPKPVEGNPLDRLGLESTFSLFAGLLIAYALLRISPASVFPIMAITIGARYFIFRTIYGEGVFWALGTALTAVGVTALLGLVTWPTNIAVVVGLMELAFAIVLFVRSGQSAQ